MANDVSVSPPPQAGTISKPLNIVLWILQVALAAMFLMAGGSKLAGAADPVALFESIGWGQWFRYVTGIIEVGCAILLLIPRFAGLGALILVCVMLGATIAEVTVVGRSPVMPLALLAALAFIAYARREQTRRLWRAP